MAKIGPSATSKNERLGTSRYVPGLIRAILGQDVQLSAIIEHQREPKTFALQASYRSTYELVKDRRWCLGGYAIVIPSRSIRLGLLNCKFADEQILLKTKLDGLRIITNLNERITD